MIVFPESPWIIKDATLTKTLATIHSPIESIFTGNFGSYIRESKNLSLSDLIKSVRVNFLVMDQYRSLSNWLLSGFDSIISVKEQLQQFEVLNSFKGDYLFATNDPRFTEKGIYKFFCKSIEVKDPQNKDYIKVSIDILIPPDDKGNHLVEGE